MTAISARGRATTTKVSARSLRRARCFRQADRLYAPLSTSWTSCSPSTSRGPPEGAATASTPLRPRQRAASPATQPSAAPAAAGPASARASAPVAARNSGCPYPRSARTGAATTPSAPPRSPPLTILRRPCPRSGRPPEGGGRSRGGRGARDFPALHRLRPVQQQVARLQRIGRLHVRSVGPPRHRLRDDGRRRRRRQQRQAQHRPGRAERRGRRRRRRPGRGR
ncbi:unnamed protein product [Scytosiphon promiscuus]